MVMQLIYADIDQQHWERREMECWPFIYFRPRQIYDLDFVVLIHFYMMQGTSTEIQIFILVPSNNEIKLELNK